MIEKLSTWNISTLKITHKTISNSFPGKQNNTRKYNIVYCFHIPQFGFNLRSFRGETATKNKRGQRARHSNGSKCLGIVIQCLLFTYVATAIPERRKLRIYISTSVCCSRERILNAGRNEELVVEDRRNGGEVRREATSSEEG